MPAPKGVHELVCKNDDHPRTSSSSRRRRRLDRDSDEVFCFVLLFVYFFFFPDKGTSLTGALIIFVGLQAKTTFPI